MTYLCNRLERLNNFGRGPLGDHSREVWSKSTESFQRSCLKKLLTDERTDGRTVGRWTTDKRPSQKLTLSTLCSCELNKVDMLFISVHLRTQWYFHTTQVVIQYIHVHVCISKQTHGHIFNQHLIFPTIIS